MQISLKYIPNGPINNNLALAQMMAWRRPDDKPLFEPIGQTTDAYMHSIPLSLMPIFLSAQ